MQAIARTESLDQGGQFGLARGQVVVEGWLADEGGHVGKAPVSACRLARFFRQVCATHDALQDQAIIHHK